MSSPIMPARTPTAKDPPDGQANGTVAHRNACWATLVTGPRVLPGLAVFARSLAQHGTRYPLVVMVTEQVDTATRAVIAQMGCVVRSVGRLDVDVSKVRGNAYAGCDGL